MECSYRSSVSAWKGLLRESQMMFWQGKEGAMPPYTRESHAVIPLDAPDPAREKPQARASLERAQDHERKQPNRWAVLGLVAIGVFMSNLDSSIVNISLPTIAHTFGVSLNGAIEWVFIAYL